MQKSDKELAVDLTIATIDMITHHKRQGGQPSLEPIGQETTISIFEKYYKAIKDVDNS
ncbi:hypothetical protein [Vagococcus fluvialis]|uniref:hypothetical protein n=1 Tax=Vagococcus fluvialis TaxID=2738 RepID=UPI001D0A1A54|nr:hypothetical protein [Vagococcus fluvialis]UDM70170.1 hypothetical protein K5L00_08455 [Vagococcus fluvialis]UDM77589.1 hypothetical protein K5K98_04000 [Vagococcus fluvialis]UDM81859.1 hypothetical protein K5K96_10935 [Vagococcus fluvialis]